MKDFTLSIILDLSLQKISQGLKNFNSKFKKSLKEAETDAKVSSREIDAAFAKLGIKPLKEVTSEIEKVKLAYDTLKRSGKLSAKEQAKAQIELKRRIKELENELNGWSEQILSIKENWLALVGTLGSAAYSIKSITSTFVEFDDAMRQVAAVSGASEDEFKNMVATAREMGATTRYSASQAAEALKYLAMAGFSASDATKALPEVLNLAAATATDLAQAADIVTNIMSQYEMKVADLSRANDVLVKATTSTNSNLVELGYAFSYAGAIAKTVGLSFEDTVAILGELHNAGIKGERAGTVLRGALSQLLKPTQEATKVLSDLGVTIYDSSGKLRPFLEILNDLQKKGASSADILTIFGQIAGPGIQSLLGMGIDSIKTLSKELQNSQGAAKKAAQQMESGIGGSIRELKSSFEELKIALGEAFEPALTGIIKSFTFLIRGIEDADVVTKFFLATVSGVPAILSIWSFGLSKLVNSYVLLRASILEAAGANAIFVQALSVGVIAYSALEISKLVTSVVQYKNVMDALGETAKKYRQEAEKLSEYKQVEIKTQEELSKMSKEEIEQYRQRLAGAIRYYGKLEASLIAQKEERDIFLQKTEAAKKAEIELSSVSEQTKRYINALKTLKSVSKETNQAIIGISIRQVQDMFSKTAKDIKEGTDALNTQVESLKKAYEFRMRLINATKSGAELEKATALEQKSYYQQVINTVKNYYNEYSKSLNDILAKERQVTGERIGLEEQILRKKIEVANAAKQVLISSLEESLAKQKQYATEVASINSQIVSAHEDLEDELRNLRRSRLTEEEQIEDKIAQAEEKRAKAREELEKGNFDLAKKYAQQAKDLYADIARTSKEKFDEAYQGVSESGQLYISILEKQKEQAEKKFEEQKQLTKSLQEAIKDLNKDLQAFSEKLLEIPDEKKAKILFEQAGLDKIKQNYNEIKDKTVTVTIQQRTIETHQTGGMVGLFRGGKLPGFGGGDKIKALLEAGEFVVRKEAVRKYGVGLLHAINSLRFNLPSIPLPDLKVPALKQQGFDTSLYRKFEINLGGARLEGFAMKDIIDEFEKYLRRRRLCGA